MSKKTQKLNKMKNTIVAILAIATITLFASCEASNDPGFDGPPPCDNCGNGNGGGGVVVTVGGGNGNGGGSGINNGAGETLYGYVYDLSVTSTVTVFPENGGQPYSVPVSTNLRNDMAQYLNTCTYSCQERFWVNIVWIQNALSGEWSQRAESGSPSPDC